MEELLIFFGFIGVCFLVVGSVLGILAFSSLRKQNDKLSGLKNDLARMQNLVASLGSADFDGQMPDEEKPDIKREGFIDRLPPETPPVAQIVKDESTQTQKPPSKPEKPAPPKKKDPQWWENFEQNIGQKWMTYAGAFILFLAVGFFVKYAFDNQWIGPTARVVLGILIGIILLVAGDRGIRKKMRPLGQGLMGAGLAALYVSLFAGAAYYKIIPYEASYGVLIAVTALGLSIAVLHNAPAISFLAVLGAILTPLMVGGYSGTRTMLPIYLIVLDVGVLGVAFFRKWRALDVLAFSGTVVLFTYWQMQYSNPSNLAYTVGWFSILFLIFLLVPFVYHLRLKTSVSIERFILAIANAMFYFGYSYKMLKYDHPYFLGFIALGIAACYISVGYVARKRLPDDGRSLFGFVAMSVVFLTMAIPLHLKVHGITLAWAVEGPILLYLGYRFKYLPVRLSGAAVLLCAIARLFLYHLPDHNAPMLLIFNKEFAGAIFVLAAMFAYSIIHHIHRKESTETDRMIKLLWAIGAGYLTIVVLHMELDEWLDFKKLHFLSSCLVPAIWALGAVVFIETGIRFRTGFGRMAGTGALAIASLLCVNAYMSNPVDKIMLVANTRFVVALIATAAIAYYGFRLNGKSDQVSKTESQIGPYFYVVSAVVLLLFLSLEPYKYFLQNVEPYHKAKDMAQMSLSIVWGVYAISCLVVGFKKKLRAIRFAALGLFGITALKLILMDSANVKQIYRIILFVVLGLLMIGASYLYHLVEKRLEIKSDGDKT